MLVEQYQVTQTANGPYRRVFLQSENHFGLTVWYEDSSLGNIIGFQLGFKANPFNTDGEFLFTIWPKSAVKVVETSQISPSSGGSGPAVKTLDLTTAQPPAGFALSYGKISRSLPVEIQNYLARALKDFL